MDDPLNLSRRQRQVMEIVYRHGEISAAQVAASLKPAVSLSTIRSHLRILEQKGQLAHRVMGGEYVYRPQHRRDRAATSAFSRLLATFFGGSLEHAVAAYMTEPGHAISDEELDRLRALIDRHRKRGEAS